MKYLLLTCLFFAAFAFGLSAQNLEAWFDYKLFNIPGDGPYVETHLDFKGHSLRYHALSDSTHQAKVQLTIIVKQGETIADFRKLDLAGPEIPSSMTADFLDVQRFLLPKGAYIIELEILDLNSKESLPLAFSQPVFIHTPASECFVSDIMLVQAYAKSDTITELTKSGYDLMPFVDQFFPGEFNDLVFYAEIYGTDEYFGMDSLFALVAYIEDAKGRITGNQQVIKRSLSAPVVPILQTFNLSEVPTGSYDVVVEVRDRSNNTIASQRLGIKRNKIDARAVLAGEAIDVSQTFVARFETRDSIMPHIESLQPIAGSLERKTMHSTVLPGDLTVQQQFFFRFWYIRNPDDPEKAWNDYYVEVLKADAEFGTRLKEGWESDRGRVYLQYGPPNTRILRYHPEGVWPYEIWHYYHIANTNDKRFLFYDPTGLTEDFTLLHSDLNTEPQNYSWQQVMRGGRGPIYNPMDNLNQNQNKSFDGQELEDLFYNPR
ncbi:MAG: GWxTD domain-containing protein [Flavobacteriales bacterium]|nr:GWxTD domain-containing protein [Flavobacteriales bacterium]